MKVGNPLDAALTGGVGTPKRASAGEAVSNEAPAKSGKVGASNDKNESATVKLSSTAASLMAGTPEFNVEKVAAVKQSIADGSFRIDPEAIADKLLANARELLDGAVR